MCGLYGFSSYNDLVDNKTLNQLHKALAYYSMERGRDATGVAIIKNNRINIHKAAVPANQFRFTVPNGVSIAMGHTRHSTQGDAKHAYNNHPWLGKTQDGTYFTFAHNGIISNDYRLKEQFHLPKTKVQTDSYVALQLLEQHQSLDFDSIRSMAEEVNGSFSFTILDKNADLYFVKGDSPLTIIYFKCLKIYIYASTSDILANALCKTPLIKELKDITKDNDNTEIINPKCGDILCIDKHGEVSTSTFKYSSLYQFDWHDYYFGLTDDKQDWETQQLLQIAEYMGYKDKDVLSLLEQGYDPLVIEEMIYEGDFDNHMRHINSEMDDGDESLFDF
jgi:glucosamine 6-phosphate synthetase-like amidotransferase/phosphosugar isomerase protein